jgi:hypothetical protein
VIQKVVAGLLGRAGALGRLDVVADYAEPLPTRVIGELMGIPAEDGPTLRQWSHAKGQFRGLSRGDKGAAARAADRPSPPVFDRGRFLARRITFLPLSTGPRFPIGPFPHAGIPPGQRSHAPPLARRARRERGFHHFAGD